MIDADTDPTRVLGDVVNPVGRCAPEFGNDEVVDADLVGGALRPPVTTRVLEIADEFLLLGIDRDRRRAGAPRVLHLIVDIVELRVAIGMVCSLARLAVGL